jgi:hypothetical protein
MSEETKDGVLDDTEDGEQTPESKEPDVKTLIAQKTHWREKAKKLEEEKKELLAKIPAEKPAEPKVETVGTDDEWKRRIEFTVTHKEFDSEDIGKLLTLSKGLGVDLEKAKDDPMFQSYYKAKQEVAASKETTPTGRSPKVQPEKPIESMTREEHRAYYEKMIQ